MGWHGMGGGLGIAVGPAYVGAALGVGWGWRPIVGLLVIPGLVALVLLVVARLPAETSTPVLAPSPPQVVLLRRSFAFILLVYMFAGFAYQGALTIAPPFVTAGVSSIALRARTIRRGLSRRLAHRPRA